MVNDPLGNMNRLPGSVSVMKDVFETRHLAAPFSSLFDYIFT